MIVQRHGATSRIAVTFIAAVVATSVFPLAAHGTYDPKHGRWLQRDPIGVRVGVTLGQPSARRQYSDGMSLYQYAKNGPVRYADPFGERAVLDFHYVEDIDLNEPLQGWDASDRGQAVTQNALAFGRPTCNEWTGGLLPREGYQLKLGTLEGSISVFALRKGHPAYERHDYYYDDVWGTGRSPDTERQAVIEHERDHARAFTEGVWPQVLSQVVPLDGLLFCNKRACERTASCLVMKLMQLLASARKTDLDTDVMPQHSGGVYYKYPVAYKLDTSECISCKGPGGFQGIDWCPLGKFWEEPEPLPGPVAVPPLPNPIAPPPPGPRYPPWIWF